MTIETIALRNDYIGNGSQTVFAFTFKVLFEPLDPDPKMYNFTIECVLHIVLWMISYSQCCNINPDNTCATFLCPSIEIGRHKEKR